MERFTEAERVEVWDRWQGGESLQSIARRMKREASSIRTMINRGGHPTTALPSRPVITPL